MKKEDLEQDIERLLSLSKKSKKGALTSEKKELVQAMQEAKRAFKTMQAVQKKLSKAYAKTVEPETGKV